VQLYLGVLLKPFLLSQPQEEESEELKKAGKEDKSFEIYKTLAEIGNVYSRCEKDFNQVSKNHFSSAQKAEEDFLHVQKTIEAF